MRLGTFVSQLQGEKEIDIPYNLLFRTDQNPVTFIYFMKGLIADLNENLLVESFIILQNTKAALLQDLAAILELPTVVPLISHNDFVKSVEKNTNFANKIENLSKQVPTRNKRSLASFWSSIFGSATEEELQKVYENEIALSKEDREMQRGISSIVETNTQLLDSFKGVTTSLESLEDRQHQLFAEINDIMESEDQFLAYLKKYGNMQDRIIMLASEYQALQSKTVLVINAIQKAQSLILTALSGEIDFSQVSTLKLRSLLPKNFRQSLSSVQAEFAFSRHGYKINYKIPKYSDAYYIYTLRQIPTYDEEWCFIANLENIIVMNQINDTIDFSDISQACAQKENNYFCEMNSVTIHGATKISCSMQLQ